MLIMARVVEGCFRRTDGGSGSDDERKDAEGRRIQNLVQLKGLISLLRRILDRFLLATVVAGAAVVVVTGEGGLFEAFGGTVTTMDFVDFLQDVACNLLAGLHGSGQRGFQCFTCEQHEFSDGIFDQSFSSISLDRLRLASSSYFRMGPEESRLVKFGSLMHSYPFCWRSDTPLIYIVVPHV
ncbi:hypothetical protein L1987_62720 [Smallanthus sonchifolius]|uniref:Uncharacterized protein n=1 Tax=Smallanthus sonchifolius TaxID=185202 RepID=A0ACB9CB91_9ASTR|nr:hypothetical protein L1987_62720 [Smallanthus sonchifolius]